MQKNQTTETQLIDAAELLEPSIAMRTDFDMGELQELASNIKRIGLINPITVRPKDGKFEIVAGHRRYKACLIAGVTKIMSHIREMSDTDVLAMRTGENYHRSEVNPVDEAQFLKRILKEDLSNIDEISGLIGKSTDYILNRLEILTYPAYFHPPLKDKSLALGVARALVQIEDEQYRKMFFDQANRDGIKVWQAEYYLAQWQAGIYKPGAEIASPADTANPNTNPIVRQKCAKCGGLAESPNLTNVFTHYECPTPAVVPPLNSTVTP